MKKNISLLDSQFWIGLCDKVNEYPPISSHFSHLLWSHMTQSVIMPLEGILELKTLEKEDRFRRKIEANEVEISIGESADGRAGLHRTCDLREDRSTRVLRLAARCERLEPSGRVKGAVQQNRRSSLAPVHRALDGRHAVSGFSS
ncbi:hypothetical protein GW17_00044437, partial [Ensete ventricosum]